MRREGTITKAIQKTTARKDHAVIYSLGGNRANIRFGQSPVLVRGVEISGNPKLLVPGNEVAVTWKAGRPVIHSASSVVPVVSAASLALATGQYPGSCNWIFCEGISSNVYGWIADAAEPLCTRWNQSGQDVIGDWWEYRAALAAGIYQFTFYGTKAAGRGITQFEQDGKLIDPGYDWYATATTQAVEYALQLVLDYSGMHFFRFTSIGKRAAGTGYGMSGSLMFMTKAT